MAHYKLMYFNLRGLAELSRYVFVYSGQEFEDFRFESADWPKYKGETMFGQVPQLVITENGQETKLCQSNTIARYLARKFGLAGKDELAQARAEMVIDHFVDLQFCFRLCYTEQNEELKKEKFKKFAEEQIPASLALLEKLLENQKTQFLAGDEVTIGDLSLAANVDRYDAHMGNTLDKFPLLKAIVEKVNSNPKLAEYKAKRPVTSF